MFSTTLTIRLCSQKRIPSGATLSFSTLAWTRNLSHNTRITRPGYDSLARSTPRLPVPLPSNYLSARHFSRSLLRLTSHNDQKPPIPPTSEESRQEVKDKKPALATIRENIYTIPNLLTVSRILACPVLGWSIINNDFTLATGLLVYAGLTDLVDGYLARRYKMQSVLGTILDPAADKTLMTTLTVTLAIKGLLPLPLAVIILGRDVLLSLSAFWIRYTSLPSPKTFARYWDFSIPSAEVRPTYISKVNTALQLLLMGTTTISPILPVDIGLGLQALQWIVGATTIWSGASYLFTKDAVRIIASKKPPTSPPPSS